MLHKMEVDNRYSTVLIGSYDSYIATFEYVKCCDVGVRGLAHRGIRLLTPKKKTLGPITTFNVKI